MNVCNVTQRQKRASSVTSVDLSSVRSVLPSKKISVVQCQIFPVTSGKELQRITAFLRCIFVFFTSDQVGKSDEQAFQNYSPFEIYSDFVVIGS